MGAIPLLAFVALILIDYNVFAWRLVLCALLSLIFAMLTLLIPFVIFFDWAARRVAARRISS